MSELVAAAVAWVENFLATLRTDTSGSGIYERHRRQFGWLQTRAER